MFYKIKKCLLWPVEIVLGLVIFCISEIYTRLLFYHLIRKCPIKVYIKDPKSFFINRNDEYGLEARSGYYDKCPGVYCYTGQKQYKNLSREFIVVKPLPFYKSFIYQTLTLLHEMGHYYHYHEDEVVSEFYAEYYCMMKVFKNFFLWTMAGDIFIDQCNNKNLPERYVKSHELLRKTKLYKKVYQLSGREEKCLTN